jgi:hypothetical protein
MRLAKGLIAVLSGLVENLMIGLEGYLCTILVAFSNTFNRIQRLSSFILLLPDLPFTLNRRL